MQLKSLAACMHMSHMAYFPYGQLYVETGECKQTMEVALTRWQHSVSGLCQLAIMLGMLQNMVIMLTLCSPESPLTLSCGIVKQWNLVYSVIMASSVPKSSNTVATGERHFTQHQNSALQDSSRLC